MPLALFLAQDFADVQGHVRECGRREAIAARSFADEAVAVRRWVPVHLDVLGFQVHQPHLTDASAGVEGELDVSVNRNGCVGDLNEEEDFCGAWVREDVATWAWDDNS